MVSTIVTGLFSFFNLGLLYYYSWKLAAVTTLLLGVMLLVVLLLLVGLLRQENSIRKIDGMISGLLLELFGGIIALRSGGSREPRLRAMGGALQRASRATRSAPGDYANRIHQWLAVYPILTAMVVYFGACTPGPAS